jgi:hypothetical protein
MVWSASFALALALATAQETPPGHEGCEQLIRQVREDMATIDRLLMALPAESDAEPEQSREVLRIVTETQRRVIDRLEELARLRRDKGDKGG